jgi:hypothetical protein
MNAVVVHAMIQARPTQQQSSHAVVVSSSSSLRFSVAHPSFHAGGSTAMWSRDAGVKIWGYESWYYSSSSSTKQRAPNNNKIDEHKKNDARSLLGELKTTVANVLSHYAMMDQMALWICSCRKQLAKCGVARHPRPTLANARRNNDCRTWLQRALYMSGLSTSCARYSGY